MASLLALLSQQTPNLQTRKGLILLGLQNDFVSPDGKLPIVTKPAKAFLKQLKEFIPAFRGFGDVIWVRSEFEANREANSEDDNGDTIIAGSSSPVEDSRLLGKSKRKASQDAISSIKRVKAAEVQDDEELFLTRTASREPCCVKDSWGSQYPAEVKSLIDEEKDIQVVKTYYSAFGSTSLLLTLRSRLITELFVCGCNTNLSVFATAMDAARYGIRITLIEDCLGYRRKDRHDEAVRQLVDIMDARVMTSAKALDLLRNPPEEVDEEEEDEDEEDEEDDPGHADRTGFDQPLAVADSDDDDEEEEEEMQLSSVRSLRVPNQTLSLRYLSLRSRPSAAKDRAPAAEPAKPPNARRPVASSARVNNSGSADTWRDRHRRGRLTDLEPTLAAGSNRGVNTKPTIGCVSRESSRAKVKHPSAQSSSEKAKQPWLDIAKTPSTAISTPRSNHRGLAALSAVSGLPQRTVDEYERMMTEAREAASVSHIPEGMPLFGTDNEAESANSRIYYDLLPANLADTVFDKLKDEVEWQHMVHLTGEVPRLVCCQGEIGADGDRPLYRHPSDQTLPLLQWSPMVEIVRKAAEAVIDHPLNHALIQLYRSGTDYISEHSDKTLDIAEGSNIVNVSFGAQRTMRLRTKRGAPSPSKASSGTSSSPPARTTYRVPMPHNSLIRMWLETNAKYLHGINADKRPAVEFTEAEKAYGGQRISLTFRHIGTFLSADEKKIWGQGATGKTKAEARPVIDGDAVQSDKLIQAFGAENQASSICWEDVYGQGSDVLHLQMPKKA
jgi:nicotinamidase-related amidase/alkylated DNA repair dioxygenase AlkB